jgi:hypothetical protein
MLRNDRQQNRRRQPATHDPFANLFGAAVGLPRDDTEPFESEIVTRYSGNAIFSESFAADVRVLSY